MKKMAILFDLDGTLLDTLEDLTDSTNYVMEQLGFPKRTLAEIREFIGNGAKKLFHQAVPDGTPMEQEQEAVRIFQSYYRDHCQIKTKPYDGILDVLAKLAQQYPMAVVSNKPDVAVKTLRDQYFPSLYARGERSDCPRKPAPDMVLRTMEARGVEGCVYVGDSEVDVLTAKNAGVPCLSVTWGFRDSETLSDAGAQYFCEDPAQLLRVIDSIVGEVYGK